MVVEHLVELSAVVRLQLEARHPEQLIGSVPEFGPVGHALDRLRGLALALGPHHWEELHALEDHYRAAIHAEAATKPECCVADPPDWPSTPDSGAMQRDRTYTRALCPYFGSPE